jgi:predicted transposase YbfD/YdcC
MAVGCGPLIEVLAEVPDPRKRRGKRHPLVAILALACAAMLAGYRSYSAIAEWGANYGPEVMRGLGFTRESGPCASTLCNVLKRIDRNAFEAKLSDWAQSVVESTPIADASEDESELVAIDGKALRGSKKQGAPAAHLLSALSHRLGLTLGQWGIDDKTNEITGMPAVLRGLVLEGRIFTVDALHTQVETAKAIIAGEGDYVMIVKKNQPELLADIKLVFEERELLAETMTTAETLDIGHGRIERRRLTASTALVGYCGWPGHQQVFAVERKRIIKKTGEVETETEYGVTSCLPERADASRLLRYVRGHWQIENKSHHVRDVTFDEDRSQVRVGSIPQVMAALRNIAIGLLRLAGESNIAAACRRFAAQPWAALELIGIRSTTE